MAEPDQESSTLRRWELAVALRRMREAKGRTIDQVSQDLTEQLGPGFSSAKISRMETAKRGVNARDVRDLCVYYEVGAAERDRLVALSRTTRERDVWLERYESLGTFIALESIAVRVRTFESVYVPGLLQTEAYSRFVESKTVLDEEAKPLRGGLDVDGRVALRKKRQARLTGDGALELHAIVDENVLRRRVGPPELMRDQLAYLIEVAALPSVTLQVLPVALGLYPGSEASGFALMEFPGQGISLEVMPGTVCYVEGILGALWAEKEADYIHIDHAFDHMAEVALTPAGSSAFITNVRDGTA
jgi:hypothetical protein